MPEDNRNSLSVLSDYVEIGSGNASPQTVIDLREEETLAIEYVHIQYSSAGTVNDKLTVWDEADGTDTADLEDDVETFFLEPGNEIKLEEPTYEDITEALVVKTNGNLDADLKVTIGGMKVTG